MADDALTVSSGIAVVHYHVTAVHAPASNPTAPKSPSGGRSGGATPAATNALSSSTSSSSTRWCVGGRA
ncbi:unnamed protein product [Linum trigynum]|uniref:Uncharacterized protein n=1 Tax=Linum trigynum TaxID=586398 RepID=A0AAV2FID3_9ROSI